MDREAIARRQRRRQAEEALADERARELALTDRLEEVVAERDGPRVDEDVFARMDPDDVVLVRDVLEVPAGYDAGGDDDGDDYFAEGEDIAEPDAAEEIERLRQEIAGSQRRQAALRRYLEAVDSLDEG